MREPGARAITLCRMGDQHRARYISHTETVRGRAVFPCRAQRAPNTTSPDLEQHAARARASTVFGEDRRRAAPQGRAPASWGNPNLGADVPWRMEFE